MSYASRWNFWIDIQFQRVSWSSASNSAPPSSAVTAAVSRLYASAGVFAFWRQPPADSRQGDRSQGRACTRGRGDMPPHIAETPG